MVTTAQSVHACQSSRDECLELVSDEITWLDVPYAEKEDARAFGAQWDAAERKWYAKPGTDLSGLRRWMPSARLHLQVPFCEKERAKALGARWDRDAGKWYITEDMCPVPFDEWRS